MARGRSVIRIAWVFAALLSAPAVAQPLTEQETLDRAWPKSRSFRAKNAIPSWIPHTHRFIYSELSHGGSQMIDFDVDTGRKTPLGEGQGAAVSPDGRSVLFMAPGPDKKADVLWAMGLDGSNRRVLNTGDPLDSRASNM